MKSYIKAKKTKSKVKVLIITILSLLIIFLLSIFTLELTGLFNLNKPKNIVDSSPESDVNYEAPTDDQKNSGEYIKNQNNQTNSNGDFTVSISSTIVDGDVIKIRSVINGLISSNGTCDLSMTNGQKEYKKSAKTYAMTNYSTCQGFNVNKSDLSSGNWQIEVSVTAESKISTANSSIELN